MALFTVTNNEGVVLLTAFNSSTTTGYGCTAPDLSPYDQTLYHNGAGAYPALGDTVYVDSGGVTPAVYEDPNNAQLADLSYLRTDVFGVRLEITCK